jgi:hypothetical protein
VGRFLGEFDGLAMNFPIRGDLRVVKKWFKVNALETIFHFVTLDADFYIGSVRQFALVGEAYRRDLGASLERK